MRTHTHGDLEQMAAATLSTSPTPQSERQTYTPAGQDPGEVAAGPRARPEVQWDAEGRVTGLAMTLTLTPHQVQTSAHHRLHAWCAADARHAAGHRPDHPGQLGLPGDRPDGDVTAGPTACRTSSRPGPSSPSSSPATPDIRGSLCNLGHFFASPGAASSWAGEHPEGALLTVPAAFRVDRVEPVDSRE